MKLMEVKGSIWGIHENVLGSYAVIPTNGVIRASDNTAVMGAGLALEAARKFPMLSRMLAHHLLDHRNVVGLFSAERVITFPSKEHWRDPSTPERITTSLNQLVVLLENQPGLQGAHILMPRVGCGLGGLDWGWVQPTILNHLSRVDRDITLVLFS